MLCKKPFKPDLRPFGCGQCIPCRVNKRRVWSNRVILERLAHEHATFVTLTYSDDKLPKNLSLNRRDPQLFLKKLRKHHSVRYYGCGEYGDISQRPHYHLALFGYPNCLRGKTFHSKTHKCCDVCDFLRDTWNLGNVHLDELNPTTAHYITGYISKKLTNKNDPRVLSVLNGRHPEFPMMSLKPGIGALALPEIQNALETELGCDRIMSSGDVPRELSFGRESLALGKYLRRKLRESYGHWSEKDLSELQKKHALEMQKMYEDYRSSKKDSSLSEIEILTALTTQKIRNIEQREKIYKKVKPL